MLLSAIHESARICCCVAVLSLQRMTLTRILAIIAWVECKPSKLCKFELAEFSQFKFELAEFSQFKFELAEFS